MTYNEIQDKITELNKMIEELENNSFIIIRKSDIYNMRTPPSGVYSIEYHNKYIMLLPEHPIHKKLQELYDMEA